MTELQQATNFLNLGKGQSSRTGRGEGRNSTTRNRSTTVRTSREVTPERSASPPLTLQKNATTRVLVSMPKAIESLVDLLGRHHESGMNSLSCSWIISFLTVKGRSMQRSLRGWYKLRIWMWQLISPHCVSSKICSFVALALNMSTMTYSEAVDLAMKIEDKGRDERSAYDVCKKDNIGGSYNNNLGANPKIGNQGRQQKGSQTWMDTVS
ncbi:hypothetical protein H5410_014850 [Solanum commersonii]|uniref:Uncharacterized protein n=1 Tax=Solanum commersonii TaxID=4109 RepID=A0A9J5ZSL6_SOLCO|nr:hypothetical protein H5410_014850 [Solanum commersonii]